jgi:hypothetical protein
MGPRDPPIQEVTALRDVDQQRVERGDREHFIEGGTVGFKLRGDTNLSFEPFDHVLIRDNSADHISLGTSGSNILTDVRVEANAVIDRTHCRSGVTYASNLAQQGSACSGDLPSVSSLGFATRLRATSTSHSPLPPSTALTPARART